MACTRVVCRVVSRRAVVCRPAFYVWWRASVSFESELKKIVYALSCLAAHCLPCLSGGALPTLFVWRRIADHVCLAAHCRPCLSGGALPTLGCRCQRSNAGCTALHCRHLQTQGFDVTYLPVRADGLVDLQQLKDALRPDTAIVSVMLVNNEIGACVRKKAYLGCHPLPVCRYSSAYLVAPVACRIACLIDTCDSLCMHALMNHAHMQIWPCAYEYIHV